MSSKMHHSGEALTSSPEIWKRSWLEAKKRSPVNLRELAGEGAEIERWNARARGYAEHTDTEDSRERHDQILSWLERSYYRPGNDARMVSNIRLEGFY